MKLLEKQIIADVFRHFHEKISQEFCDYVENVALVKSRYLFTFRKGKKQFGYCTHCRHEYDITDLPRNDKTAKCGVCGSDCVVKASGRSRKYLIDDAYIVWYERSVVNPKAITARGVHVKRDYRKDFRGVDTMFANKAVYLFEPGKGGTMLEFVDYRDGGKWFVRENIHSFTNNYHWDVVTSPRFCPEENIVHAVNGSPFQYSTWESWKDGDMVKFFDLFAKYPCIEYLSKLGFRKIVSAKLYGHPTYSAVNWRGKNLLEVLKVTKQDFNLLRTSKLDVGPWELFLFQQCKKDEWNVSIEELRNLSTEIYDTRASDLKNMLHRTTVRKLAAYLKKQQRNREVFQRYRSKGEILQTWNDYINDCLKLNYDLSHETVFYPANLYQAHQNTIKQIKVKEDEALKKRFADRSQSLQKYRFEALGFLLRPVTDQKELIDEGKALEHCVGTYANSFVNGECDLFVVRKADDPDKPFYTMEIQKKEISQCRGLKNCNMTDEVKAFVEAFKAAKLTPKKQKNNVVLQTKDRLEVAV